MVGMALGVQVLQNRHTCYLRAFTGVQQALFLCCVFFYRFVWNVSSIANHRGWSIGTPMTSKATEAVSELVQSAGSRTAPSSLAECVWWNCCCFVHIGNPVLSEHGLW